MKTAMKRLLSFVLVAMMLVSVVPFQASALGDVEPRDDCVTFVDPHGTVEAIQSITEYGDEPVNGEYFTYAGNPKQNVKKSDLAGEVLYYKGYPADFKVTVTGIKGGATVEFDTTLPMPFDDTAALKAEATAKVTNYNTEYDASQTTVTVDKIAKTVVVTVVPADPTTWTIVVSVNNQVEKTATTNVYVDPTESHADLVAALAEVTGKYDTDKYDVVPGAWSIVKPNASINVTVTEKVVPPAEYDITFILCDKYDDNCAEVGKCQTVTITTVNQKLTHTPDLPERYRYQFSEWKNKATGVVGLQSTYNSDVTYEAIYTKKADTNLHKVSVYGVIYSHGKTHTLGSPLTTIYVTDGANLLTALKEKATDIQNELDGRGYTVANKYAWDGATFYDNYYLEEDDEVSSGTKVTGDGTFYVKVNYTGNNKVQLYVHTAKTLTIKDTITLTTYVPGETINKSEIVKAVENEGWRYSNFRTYTRDSWEKIVDRDSTSAADETKAFEVQTGETEIHVYLTNSSTSSSTNNSDNPKTGDTILMAVTALGLSAAALAAVYFFTKKKAI